MTVRVVDYRLDGVDGALPIYRLVTTILDPERAPALDLAALYRERWEIETAFDELKTHLRGARIVLPSKTPAQQDPRSRPSGILRSAAGPLRHPRPDPRSGPEG